MLSELLDKARADRPLWMPELREAFLNDPTARPVILRLTLHDGTWRDFSCAVPKWKNDEERDFCAGFLHACVYNCLAAYSGRELRLFFDTAAADLLTMGSALDTVFQVNEPRRRGFGKVINIADRIARSRGGPAFRFVLENMADYAPLPKEPAKEAVPLDEKLCALCGSASNLRLCGIDVGGTDIKLAASDGNRLVCTREYDWNPAAYGTVEEIIGPILLLTRLMRACIAAEKALLPVEFGAALTAALDKDASLSKTRAAVEAVEDYLGGAVNVLDGVGLSFPDIVIRDRILGGETPKTDGMRKNTAVDYETAFAKLGALGDALRALCREGGRVRIINDGSMAAFTAAAELAHSDNAPELRGGVVAHSLGTDLGTGVLTAEGEIPPLPLEMYDLILDLGSFSSRAFPPEDLRSTRNENSGLAGARRYMGQAAAYRLAWRLEPRLLDGYTVLDGDCLHIASEPRDLRKPCLESLMRAAEEGDPAACEVFREIGRNLAVVSREMVYLVNPETDVRFLFGRFVKRAAVFALLEEGFTAYAPELRLLPSDESLAKTPLMRALSKAPDVTVAQFGQAVGAIYYALS